MKNIYDSSVGDAGTVLLEGNAKDEHFCALDFVISGNHELDHFGGNIVPHIVVEAVTCEDNFRMVAILLGFMGEVVRINANAVTPDKTGFKGKKVPFSARSRKHFMGVDPHAVEDHGQLVNKGNVDNISSF